MGAMAGPGAAGAVAPAEWAPAAAVAAVPPRLRLAAGTGGRAALEPVAGDEVLAVDVATVFGAPVLGGLRGGTGEGVWARAWGRSAADGAAPAVRFGRCGLCGGAGEVVVPEVVRPFGRPGSAAGTPWSP